MFIKFADTISRTVEIEAGLIKSHQMLICLEYFVYGYSLNSSSLSRFMECTRIINAIVIYLFAIITIKSYSFVRRATYHFLLSNDFVYRAKEYAKSVMTR